MKATRKSALSQGERRTIHVRDAKYYYGDPSRNIKVMVAIDWHRIARQLGARAMRSKAKVSRCMNGAVVVKYLEDWVSV